MNGSARSRLGSDKLSYSHDRVANEQCQETQCYQGQTSYVQESTFCEQFREFHLLLVVIGIRIVQIVILFNVFRKQQ